MAVNLSIEQFRSELQLIEDKSIRDFTEYALSKAPAYFWINPSSSSGKYHPPQSNGQGGLVRHTKAVVYFANKLCEVYSSVGQERDCIIAACILHDIVKYGTGLPHTTKTHDAEGATFVRQHARDFVFDPVLAENIACGVEWHMGKWTKRSDGKTRVFPERYLAIEKIVHLADVISAQNQVELIFLRDGSAPAAAPVTSAQKQEAIKDGTLKMPFGKHAGKTIEEIPSDYLKWAADNLRDGDVKEAAKHELAYRNQHGLHFD